MVSYRDVSDDCTEIKPIDEQMYHWIDGNPRTAVKKMRDPGIAQPIDGLSMEPEVADSSDSDEDPAATSSINQGEEAAGVRLQANSSNNKGEEAADVQGPYHQGEEAASIDCTDSKDDDDHVDPDRLVNELMTGNPNGLNPTDDDN